MSNFNTYFYNIGVFNCMILNLAGVPIHVSGMLFVKDTSYMLKILSNYNKKTDKSSHLDFQKKKHNLHNEI